MPQETVVVHPVVLLVASFLGAKKIFDYSAAPDKPKQSDFIFPASPDQEKQTVQVLERFRRRSPSSSAAGSSMTRVT